MFYAHFVLSKKGPLARIWLAAHWDKKLTKAHVFETNIDSSVEAIMQPKVKLALRTSGHLLLGVVRIYSRKAKYLLADCNEAFVKIKMAFRPGVVDLPEENREAAINAITLQENFHDFDTTLADLNDLDVQAQFSVNQSRPEDITMREDLASITFVDDGFGDVGFDDREILRDATNIEESLYKQPDLSVSNHQPIEEKEKTLNENVTADKPMDVDLEPPVDAADEFGGPVDGGFMDADDDDDDNDNDGGFGGGVDQEFFGDDFMNSGGLFEEAPLGDVSMPPPVEAEEHTEDTTPESNSVQPQKEAEPVQPQVSIVAPGASGEQTTLINNEEEAFALPPLDATIVPGVEKKGKRKRKLIVDEQKGIPSETMKLQLSDTSDIISTLDLAPPTKKLMHWKETGGVEKLFSLPGRSIASKAVSKLFSRNLLTKRVEEQDDEERIELEAPEITREEDKTHNKSRARVEEISTIMEEPSILEASVRSRKSEINVSKARTPAPATPAREPEPEKSHVEEPSVAQDIFASTFNEGVVDMPADPNALDPRIDPYDDPPSIAPFSVPPPSVPPPSVPPPSEPPAPEAPTFNIEGDFETEAMPETTEQEDQRWTKRTHQMQNTFDIAFRYKSPLSFQELSRNLNRKQAASRFYTLLVLKKFQAVEVHQPDEFGDIYIRKGPKFGIAC